MLEEECEQSGVRTDVAGVCGARDAREAIGVTLSPPRPICVVRSAWEAAAIVLRDGQSSEDTKSSVG